MPFAFPRKLAFSPCDSFLRESSKYWVNAIGISMGSMAVRYCSAASTPSAQVTKYASVPWSNSPPNFDAEPARLAIFPSKISVMRQIKSATAQSSHSSFRIPTQTGIASNKRTAVRKLAREINSRSLDKWIVLLDVVRVYVT